MNISARTKTLLDRLPDHPLSASMRTAMIAAAAASEGFAGHKIALESDGRMTPLGKSHALKEALTGNHGKAWARANASVLKARKEITARRDALVIKAVDKTDLAGALERQEIRQWFRSLDLGVRQPIALATKDRRVLEALVTAPPELSGIAGASAASEIEARYLELTYADELESISAADAVVAEAEAAMHVSRNELRSTIDVDMHPRDFDEIMKPVETIRPWIVGDSGIEQVVEVGADGKTATYRKATEADVAFGVRYKNLEEYKRAQGLDVAA
jgi:hypothetical protein